LVLFEKGNSDDEKDLIEFYIDNDEMFMEMIKNLLKGNPSIRKNPMLKIRIVFGQDESIF